VYAVTSVAIPRQHRFPIHKPCPRACTGHLGKHREHQMAKTNYQVIFNGKVVGIRKSDRIYTHAVVVQDDADAFYPLGPQLRA
jgi:hypothetical protein